MSIYIARGQDTLGPYHPAEAASLVKSGYLSPHDLAARNGDIAWTSLSSFLPEEEAAPEVKIAVAAPPGTSLSRGSRAALVISVLLVPVVLVGGLLVIASRSGPPPSRPLPPESPEVAVRSSAAPAAPIVSVNAPPAARATPLAIASLPPAVSTPSPPPTVPGGPLNGTISLATADGPPAGLDAVQVRAYLIPTLIPYLAKKKAEAQEELTRLAPQLAAAEAERDARVATERAALQALLAVDPSDAMRPSLEFVHEQAKAAVKNAEDDCRYFTDLRREASSGSAYFQDLPAPVAAANTNPAGGFTLELPPGGPFAVAAYVRQITADGPRLRYWLVKVPPPGEKGKIVTLSEANVTSAASEESLVLTAD